MSAVRALLYDRFMRVTVLVMLVVLIPYFVPFLSDDALYDYADPYALIPPLIVAVISFQLGLKGVKSKLDRQFWHIWTVAYLFWVAVRVVLLVVPLDLWTSRFDLLTDILYVLSYLTLIVALAVEPDRRPTPETPRTLTKFELVGLSVMVLGLWVYYSLIPGILDRAAYDSWVPSMLLYVALDTYVLVRCLYLLRTTRSPLWKTTYTWLAVTEAVILATDILEMVEYAEWIPTHYAGTFYDLPWFLPFITVVAAARMHRILERERREPSLTRSPSAALQERPLFGGTLVVCALVVPVVHFASYSLGLLDPDTRAVREVLVLAMLLYLLAMEHMNQLAIKRRNLQLAESRRQAAEKRDLLAAAVEHAGEGVVISDSAGTIEYVNPAFVNSLGYAAEEVVGRSVMVLKSGEHDDDFYEQIWNTIAGGELWKGRLQGRRKDGSVCELTASIAPVADENGDIVRFVAVERDITREMRLERRLGEAQKLEALGTLAGGIAHDFNNILAAISGYGELLWEQLPQGSHERVHAEQVLHAADRAKGITKQILGFARRSAEERKSTDIAVLLRETVSLLRASLPSTIDIRAEASEDAGAVMADSHQLQQVLLNLGTNAAHSIGDEHGELTLKTAFVNVGANDRLIQEGLSEGEYVSIELSDTGCGMDEATLARIFEPFFTTKEVGAGTGLGLSVVHGIVHSHAGAIDVETELGVGTTFRIYLPAYVDQDADPVVTMPAASGPKGTGHVLVVDDERSIREMIKRHLERLGYSVTLAENGETGLRAFESNPQTFDALITDQTMPKKTGLQLVTDIRRQRPDVPVILMTGFSRAVTSDAVKEAGIKQMLHKPFTASELAGMLQDLLSAQQTA